MLKKILSLVAVASFLIGVFFIAAPAQAVTNDELQAQINTLLAEMAKLQTDLAAKTGTPVAGYPTTTISTFSSVEALKTSIASTSGNSATGQAINGAVQAMADFGMKITDFSSDFVTVNVLVNSIYTAGDPTEVQELLVAMKNLGGTYASVKTSFGSMKGFFDTIHTNIGSKRLPYLTSLFEDLKATGGTWASVTIDSGFTSLKALIEKLGGKGNVEDISAILAKLEALQKKYDDLYASSTASLSDLTDTVSDGNSSYYDRCNNYNKGKYGSYSKNSSYYSRCRETNDSDGNNDANRRYNSNRNGGRNGSRGGSQSGRSSSGQGQGQFNPFSALGSQLAGGCKGGASSIPSNPNAAGNQTTQTGGGPAPDGSGDTTTSKIPTNPNTAGTGKKSGEDGKQEAGNVLLGGQNADVLYKIACSRIYAGGKTEPIAGKEKDETTTAGYFFKLKSNSTKDDKPANFIYVIDSAAVSKATADAQNAAEGSDPAKKKDSGTNQIVIDTASGVEKIKELDKVDYSTEQSPKTLQCNVKGNTGAIDQKDKDKTIDQKNAQKESKEDKKINAPICSGDGGTCSGKKLFKLLKVKNKDAATAAADAAQAQKDYERCRKESSEPDIDCAEKKTELDQAQKDAAQSVGKEADTDNTGGVDPNNPNNIPTMADQAQSSSAQSGVRVPVEEAKGLPGIVGATLTKTPKADYYYFNNRPEIQSKLVGQTVKNVNDNPYVMFNGSKYFLNKPSNLEKYGGNYGFYTYKIGPQTKIQGYSLEVKAPEKEVQNRERY